MTPRLRQLVEGPPTPLRWQAIVSELASARSAEIAAVGAHLESFPNELRLAPRSLTKRALEDGDIDPRWRIFRSVAWSVADDDAVAILVRAPALATVKHLSLATPRSAAALRAIGAALPNVTSIALHTSAIDRLDVEALRGPLAARLEALACAHARFEPDALAALTTLSFPRLARLNLRGTGLNPDGLAVLASANLPHLDALDLSRNPLGGDALVRFFGALDLSRLQDLDLSECSLGPDGAERLAEVEILSQLTALCLNNNAIGTDGLSALVRSGRLGYLQRLSVDKNGIDDGGARPIATLACAELQAVSLSWNELGPRGAAVIAGMVAPKLDELAVASCGLGVDGTRRLAQATDFAPRNLDVSWNDLDGASLDALIESPIAAQLEKLDLSMNRLGPRAAAAVIRSPSIRKLGLTGTELGDDGARHLASATFERLERLSVEQNGLGRAGAIAIASAALPRLLSFRIGSNGIGDEGVLALTKANWIRTVVELDLASNGIGETGAVALSKITPSRLVILDLYDNEIGDEGAAALASTPALRGLETLGLHGGARGYKALALSPHLAATVRADFAREKGVDDPAVKPARPSTRRVSTRPNKRESAPPGPAISTVAPAPPTLAESAADPRLTLDEARRRLRRIGNVVEAFRDAHSDEERDELLVSMRRILRGQPTFFDD